MTLGERETEGLHLQCKHGQSFHTHKIFVRICKNMEISPRIFSIFLGTFSNDIFLSCMTEHKSTALLPPVNLTLLCPHFMLFLLLLTFNLIFCIFFAFIGSISHNNSDFIAKERRTRSFVFILSILILQKS